MPRTHNTRSLTKATAAAQSFEETGIEDAKQPLQDITEQFLVPHSSDHISSKPKRKARAPGGALGAKLRAEKQFVIPSSLPPSSPPPSSSHLPAFEAEYHNPCYAESGSLPFPTTDKDLEFEYRLGFQDLEQDIELADLDEEIDASDASDPFGFFAVEKKLKAQRDLTSSTKNVRARYRATRPSHINTTLMSRDEEYGDNFLTDDEILKEVQDVREGLQTPHRRKGKRRAIASPGGSSVGIFSPRTSSMPSTPSPLKPAASRTKGKEKAVRIDDSQDEVDEVMGSLKTTANDLAGRRTKKPRHSKSPVDPRALAMTLEALLPKRPARRRVTAGRGKKQVKIKDGDGKEADEGTPDKTVAGAATRTKAAATKGRPHGRSKGKGKEGEVDDIDGDEQKKWERERQARLEYFKKLQDYKVEKENVYIV